MKPPPGNKSSWEIAGGSPFRIVQQSVGEKRVIEVTNTEASTAIL